MAGWLVMLFCRSLWEESGGSGHTYTRYTHTQTHTQRHTHRYTHTLVMVTAGKGPVVVGKLQLAIWRLYTPGCWARVV